MAPSRRFAAIDPETGGGRLALNGGPTETVRLRDSADNPALDRASDAEGFDQRGFARPRPEGTNPDIGAFELDQRSGASLVSALTDGTKGFDFSAGEEEARQPDDSTAPADDQEAVRLAQAENDFYF